MRNWASVCALLAVGALMSGPVLAGGSSAATLAAPCAGCHGAGGKSKGAAPSIAGLSAEAITKAMTEFKSGARKATVMDRIAKGYDDEDVAKLAAYFSAKK